ncbi:MAG: type VI secretion system contractile sheath large subunit [Alphaproteobacteria bacterium]|nr:type VI secretion system contractile sheath large subunit [Alphaproteobacteria bacterium]
MATTAPVQQTVTAPDQTATAMPPATSLAGQAIVAIKQSDPNEMKDLISVFVKQALLGVLTWDKNIVTSVNAAIKEIDQRISQQLAAILHQDDFKGLEGSWRGLHYLVMNSETGESLKLKLLNATKKEIFKDLDGASEFDQSTLFKKVYEEEYGSPGGEPYGALIGDYAFENTPDDIDMLRNIAGVAASSFCPFITSCSSNFFGFQDWTELSKPRDLEKIFESTEYIKWKSFREAEDSRFVTLTLPRALARLPYGASTHPIDEFDFEETTLDAQGYSTQLHHEDYCWMSSAYTLGAKLTDAFAKFGWCTAIRGAEGGGKVENLPLHIFKSDDGDIDSNCPTEIGITDRREAELSKLGFLPLCHYKETDYAVFFGAQTTQKPLKYDLADATANAAISARLPYIMATSRIAHYLKIMARDKIGSFMERSDVEAWLNRWILNYVNSNPHSGQDLKSEYPLAEAKIQVVEILESPGSYNAIAWLRPWLQMEELSASMRLVARIPQLSS